MRFDLGMNGYDVTKPSGDIVEWNVQMYDCDWFWPVVSYFRFTSVRTWVQVAVGQRLVVQRRAHQRASRRDRELGCTAHARPRSANP